MGELAKHLWPFRPPADAGRLGDRLQKAGEFLYWSGVAHGVLGAAIALAALAGVLLIVRRSVSREIKLSIGVALFGALLWYSGQVAKAPVAPAPAPPKVEPVKPKPEPRPKRPH